MKVKKKTIGFIIYLILLMIPIYWMLNMSLRSNADILASFALYPKGITFKNYLKMKLDVDKIKFLIENIDTTSTNILNKNIREEDLEKIDYDLNNRRLKLLFEESLIKKEFK